MKRWSSLNRYRSLLRKRSTTLRHIFAAFAGLSGKTFIPLPGRLTVRVAIDYAAVQSG